THGVDRLTHLMQSRESIPLRRGARPLDEPRADMPARVPGPGVHLYLAVRAILPQVIIDKRGLDTRTLSSADTIQEWPVTTAPEVGSGGLVAEPATILAIGACCHQRRIVTVTRPLVDFCDEPIGLHACELSIR